MKKLHTILLDCDGPMANFCAGFLSLVEEETGFAFGTEVITTWGITDAPFFAKVARDVGRDQGELKAKVWQKAKRIGFCSSLPVVAGAREAVEELRGLAEHVEVLTAPLNGAPTWMAERTEWLHRHFGFHDHDVHFSHRKERFRGEILVDDKTSHCEAFAAQDGDHALLWDRPYNREHGDLWQVGTGVICRVRSWETVVRYARELIANR